MIKTRRMRWTGHLASVRDRSGTYRVLVGDLKERTHLEDLCLDEKIILKLIFKKWDGEAWTGSSWLRISTGDRLS